MSLFEDLNPFSETEGLDPGLSALLKHGQKLYSRYEIAKHLLPDEDLDLSREEHRLDIALKRRSLGLPESSQDLEDAENDHKPFLVKALGYGLQKIPTPGFLQPKASSGMFPIFKIAEGIEDVGSRLPSFLRYRG